MICVYLFINSLLSYKYEMCIEFAITPQALTFVIQK